MCIWLQIFVAYGGFSFQGYYKCLEDEKGTEQLKYYESYNLY
jgi:hypothetical protein